MPSLASATAAAASARFAKDTDFRVSITDAPGAESYPISSFTWLLVHADSKDPAKAKLLRNFLNWMITPEAQAMAGQLQYAPLPDAVITLIKPRIAALKSGGKPIPAS